MTQISSTTPPVYGVPSSLATETGADDPALAADAQPAAGPGVDPLAKFGATQGLHPGVQQFAHGEHGGGPLNATGTTQAKAAPARARTPDDLKQLARDPNSAHQEWKSLSATERDAVVKQMEQFYGKDFAQKFVDAAKSGKTDLSVDTWQPGTGPSKEKLLERGFRFAGKEFTGNAAWDIDLWVHPSGKRVRMDVSTYKFGSADVDKPSKPGPAANMPAFIDPKADRHKLFGEMIAMKEDVDAALGRGDMVLYQSGAMELFLEGEGGNSYVFLPIAGWPGGYAVYGPDGRRLNDKAWIIPPSDIPDPKKDPI